VVDPAQPASLLVIVEASGLSVRYGSRRAVDGVSFTAQPGAFLAVIGPNGSGKSSLVKAVAGLVAPEGVLTFDRGARPARGVGYMPQDIGARATLTVLEAVLLGRLGRLGLRVAPSDLAEVRTVLVDLGIEAFAPRYLDELSGGQRQMVFLAQALASEPRLLLLDEPISALDIRHQFEVLDRLRALTTDRGLTTICVLHDLNAAGRYADQILALKAGRAVAYGPAAQVLTRDLVATLFEVEAVVEDRDGRPCVTPLRTLREKDQ
jgi:iron complex transport system ATP-binding protein